MFYGLVTIPGSLKTSPVDERGILSRREQAKNPLEVTRHPSYTILLFLTWKSLRGCKGGSFRILIMNHYFNLRGGSSLLPISSATGKYPHCPPGIKKLTDDDRGREKRSINEEQVGNSNIKGGNGDEKKKVHRTLSKGPEKHPRGSQQPGQGL
jgi:hypothetical protein